MDTFTADRVGILDPVTGEVVAECRGPLPDGTCPLMIGGVVPCAGHRVASLTANPEHWRVYVPPGTTECPLARPLEMAYW